jgi:hypothetical protein
MHMHVWVLDHPEFWTSLIRWRLLTSVYTGSAVTELSETL